MSEKQYKISAPVGNYVTPKEVMTEKEVREFSVQLIQDPDWNESWKEKAAKDPFESIVEWLNKAGYQVNEA